MKAFISWSGERSKETALIIHTWIQKVLQAVEPWISSEDIRKGNKWLEAITKELETTKLGIICLNKENVNDAKWLVFEAGALSKTKDASVCTFLLDIEPSDVSSPLSIFQHTLFNKKDLLKLVHFINKRLEELKEKSVETKMLDDIFEAFWPQLEKDLNDIKNKSLAVKTTKRNDRELLEEILNLVRENNNSPTSSWLPITAQSYNSILGTTFTPIQVPAGSGLSTVFNTDLPVYFNKYIIPDNNQPEVKASDVIYTRLKEEEGKARDALAKLSGSNNGD